jgi:hypothetical protein
VQNSFGPGANRANLSCSLETRTNLNSTIANSRNSEGIPESEAKQPEIDESACFFYSPSSLCPSLRAGPGPPATEVPLSFGTSGASAAASADSDRRRLPAVNLNAGHAGSEFLRSAPGRPSLTEAEGARPDGPGAHRPLAAWGSRAST